MRDVDMIDLIDDARSKGRKRKEVDVAEHSKHHDIEMVVVDVDVVDADVKAVEGTSQEYVETVEGMK